MEALHYDYAVDGKDFVSCGRASENVKQALKLLGLPSALIRRVAIAMYEGEVNMVIHAHGGVASVDIGESLVRVLLKDTGPGIADVEKAMKEGYSTATEQIRELGFGAGMGLPNMKKYSDRMTIRTQVGVGTEVALEFDI
jgi:anti-sigma regulatory factor (Ser/Thr protein kinase)